jgi:poly(hydroxyalkanoate) granule-associated protein
MSKKTGAGAKSSPPPFPDKLKDSAQQIWLAGLGAFTQAQQEGSKAFDTLVQEGLAMQRKAQSTAEAKLAEAGQKVSSMAQDIGSRASGQWDRIEGLFEDRVARALERLGMPSALQVQALERRLAALEKKLPAARAPVAKKTATATAKKSPARKAPAKRPATRKKTP